MRVEMDYTCVTCRCGYDDGDAAPLSVLFALGLADDTEMCYWCAEDAM